MPIPIIAVRPAIHPTRRCILFLFGTEADQNWIPTKRANKIAKKIDVTGFAKEKLIYLLCRSLENGNEVEELIESVASRRVKNKDIDDKDTKDESQAETSLFPNFMSIGFDKLGSGRKSKRTKSNSSAKRNVPKEMSPETKVKIINQVILISSLLTFSKSYDVIDIMKHYSRINQHPDFSNLKKVYKKKHTKQK